MTPEHWDEVRQNAVAREAEFAAAVAVLRAQNVIRFGWAVTLLEDAAYRARKDVLEFSPQAFDLWRDQVAS